MDFFPSFLLYLYGRCELNIPLCDNKIKYFDANVPIWFMGFQQVSINHLRSYTFYTFVYYFLPFIFNYRRIVKCLFGRWPLLSCKPIVMTFVSPSKLTLFKISFQVFWCQINTPGFNIKVNQQICTKSVWFDISTHRIGPASTSDMETLATELVSDGMPILFLKIIGRESSLLRHNKNLLYKVAIRPIMLYACPVWGSAANTHIQICKSFRIRLSSTSTGDNQRNSYTRQ